MNIIKQKQHKAFSLVEVLITLAIFSILLSMLSNILILNLEVSRKITARTRIREELSEVAGLIQRDMRNSSKIISSECGENIEIPAGSTDTATGCRMSVVSDVFWVQLDPTNPGTMINDCDPYLSNGIIPICKVIYDPVTTSYKTVYKTSDILRITGFNIEKETITLSEQSQKAIIIVTIQAEAANQSWDIKNQVRQITVTTRNF